jgi:hypothetical protein
LATINNLGPADLPAIIVVISLDKPKANGGPDPMKYIVAFPEDYRREKINVAKLKAEKLPCW